MQELAKYTEQQVFAFAKYSNFTGAQVVEFVEFVKSLDSILKVPFNLSKCYAYIFTVINIYPKFSTNAAAILNPKHW